jgi:predicted ABC-type ATPase
MDEAITAETNCVVESTLSGRTFQKFLTLARDSGFIVRTLYLWLDTVETSLERVRKRVQKGGHDVPEVDVRRRFSRSLTNFWNLYRPLSDHWVLMLNSGTQTQDVAFGTMVDVTINDPELFSRFQSMIDEDR